MKGLSLNREVASYTMQLMGEPGKIFPLLCPVREYEWIEGWEGELLFSASGYAEPDCVFRTNFPGEGQAVWVVSSYAPDERIEFVRVSSNRAIHYSIKLSDEGNGSTTAVWTQVITALIPEANDSVARYAGEEFPAVMGTLEKMLNHYLTTGSKLHVAVPGR